MVELIKTRFGWCAVISDGASGAIKEVVLPSPDKGKIMRRLAQRGYKDNLMKFPLSIFARDLLNYFNGKKVDFQYEIDLNRYSNFERAVYRVLRGIPYGKRRTYQWVARKVGSPRAIRAVGNALAKNPLPIIIPCHRIIRSDGSLGNFSALGGIKLKEGLLRMEGVIH
ncbi:MAG: methylated-DNA--[protein]-cysteine S-methyltransferase [Planctomycetota bacterium]|nr:methylated-DNA--[protein]-cysteine S-methyltransferase [Planctomycetota bacterium]MDI6787618.1 methylated-DNA--[protein]-cysteine S-methyltransferase [Planctomycetota bacterium]